MVYQGGWCGGDRDALTEGTAECWRSNTGRHKWEKDHLMPEHWVSESVEPTKERARCGHCGVTTDYLSVLDNGPSGPFCPTGTGF